MKRPLKRIHPCNLQVTRKFSECRATRFTGVLKSHTIPYKDPPSKRMTRKDYEDAMEKFSGKIREGDAVVFGLGPKQEEPIPWWLAIVDGPPFRTEVALSCAADSVDRQIKVGGRVVRLRTWLSREDPENPLKYVLEPFDDVRGFQGRPSRVAPRIHSLEAIVLDTVHLTKKNGAYFLDKADHDRLMTHNFSRFDDRVSGLV